MAWKIPTNKILLGMAHSGKVPTTGTIKYFGCSETWTTENLFNRKYEEMVEKHGWFPKWEECVVLVLKW